MVIVTQMMDGAVHDVEIPNGSTLKVAPTGTLLVIRGTDEVVAVFGQGMWLSAYERERSGRSS